MFSLGPVPVGELSTMQHLPTTRKEFTRKDLKEITTRGKNSIHLKQTKTVAYGGISRRLD